MHDPTPEMPMRVLSCLLLACAMAFAVSASEPGLEGEWVVDLSAEPGTPYTRPMQLALNADGTVTGTFYNSTIEAGRWHRGRDRVCASFRTTDGEGPYHTAVCQTGATVAGQTWAEHRDFLFNWNAVRPGAAAD